MTNKPCTYCRTKPSRGRMAGLGCSSFRDPAPENIICSILLPYVLFFMNQSVPLCTLQVPVDF